MDAFEALVEEFQQSVFNVALYKSKNYFDAEDLTQDIFLAAFRALDSLQAPENFSSWLFGIAYNRCHKWFQRERIKVVKFDELRERARRDERQRERRARATPALGSSDLSAASEFMRKLPPEVRDVLRMKYLEGLSYREIEERLGINSNRIDYLIRKGKQLLRGSVEREERV